jgi:hypothetical protein
MLACGVGLLMVSATAVPAQSYNGDIWQNLFAAPGFDQDWPRHFRVGALVGFNFKADFSMSGPFTVSGRNPGTPGVGGQNHDYDDGYVRLDATGNSGGETWNWGYDSASQLVGNRLYYHSASSYTASDSASAGSGAQVGFDTAYGGHLFPLWGGAFGWELGFGLMPIKIKNNLSQPTTVTRIVHSFDASGVDLPDAPYQGGFNGPSVTIGDIANAEPSEILSGTLSGSQTVDVTMYNLRLGPTLYWELHPRVGLEVSAGAAVGILSGGLKYDETLLLSDGSTAINQGKVGDTQIVYGGYVAGTLLYHAVKNGDLYVGFQYMPMSSATFSGGGREAKLDLSGGLYISAGINWPF